MIDVTGARHYPHAAADPSTEQSDCGRSSHHSGIMSNEKPNASGNAGGPFRFRVSDSLEVPLRGHLLRLRRVEGQPSMKELAPGSTIRVSAPSGETRNVVILGHSATGGRATQLRLETTGELDIVIPREQAGDGEQRIGIGWSVSGPAG